VKSKLIRSSAGPIVAIFGVVAAITPTPSFAQKNAPDVHVCSLLTRGDVLPIVGVNPVTQETKGGTTCMWGDPGNDPNKFRLLIQAPAFSATSEMSFKANRKQAFDDKTSQAKDEPQLGKNAFSAVMEDGAEIIILKKNVLLNIRFLSGRRGTPENVEGIRKVATKVAASF
jgi:hypothetical protein